jgi:hypothetical protein
MQYILVILLLLIGNSAWADVLPVPDKTGRRLLPDETRLEIDTEYKRRLEEQLGRDQKAESENEALRKQLENLRNLRAAEPNLEGGGLNNKPRVKEIEKPKPNRQTVSAPTANYGSGIQTFAIDYATSGEGEILPAGSWVRAKILTGAEANNRYPYNMTLQLDYAFTGPNGSKVPLQGCITIAEAKADLSIERVIILPTKLSCVRNDGEYVERKVTGFVAGRDSANGVQGVYSSKQGKVFLQALLASIAKGAGAAVQMTQFTETISGSENAAVAKNFTGNVGQFALAKGVTDAATLVTDWYLNQAKALLPTIMVGSGQDVWIIVTESVEIPPLAENSY